MCRLIKTRPSNLCPKRDLRNLEMPAKYQNYQELKASNQFQIKGQVYEIELQVIITECQNASFPDTGEYRYIWYIFNNQTKKYQ